MPTLTHDCPHCGTAKSAFALDFSKKCGLNTRTFAAIGLCSGCQQPALMVFSGSHAGGHPPSNVTPEDFASSFELKSFWPRSPQPRLPSYTPEKILNVLREAEDARARRVAGVHTAGMAYGKVLDLATKAAGGKADKLGPRITEIAAAGKITQDLAAWMQTLRVVRNDAMHEDEAMTVDEIEELGEATQLLLQYLFTMPGMLAKIKKEHDAKLAAAKNTP